MTESSTTPVHVKTPLTSLLKTKLDILYSRTQFHKFNKGDILILKKRNIFGYGIRPIIMVEGYKVGDIGLGKDGHYKTTVYTDTEFVPEYNEHGKVIGNRWWEHNEVPQGVERTMNKKLYLKLDIERKFKKVPVGSVNKPLALYVSEEVKQRRSKARKSCINLLVFY